MVKNFFISHIENDNIIKKAIEDINLLPDVEKVTYQSFQQKIKVTFSKDADEKIATKDIIDIIHNYDDNINVSDKMLSINGKINRPNVILYIIGIVISGVTYTQYIPVDYKWIGYLIGLLLCSKVLIKKVYNTVFLERRINESLLIALAIIGAFLIKDYKEALIVLSIYLLANYLSWKASILAKKDVSDILHKEETIVYKLNDKVVLATPIKEIQEKDIIIVRPGEIIPLTTRVLEGRSVIDMSPISNENFQEEAKPGVILKSGGINLDKPLKLLVLKRYNEGLLKELITKTEEAMEHKKGFAKTSETIGEIYVKVVAGLAALLLIYSFFSGNPSQFIYKGLILLATSCPWAMLLSTPIAHNYALSLAKKLGVLIKDTGSIDAIGKMRTLFFTKTGILTTGQYKIKEIRPYKNIKEDYILTYAAIGELQAKHPIAQAVRKALNKELNIDLLEKYREEKGKGAMAIYGGKTIVVGTENFLDEQGVDVVNDYSGTQIHVGVDGQYIGSIALEENLKPEGIEVIEKLKQLKIDKVAVLTGEIKQGATEVLAPLKISKIYGELNIEDKVSRIRREHNRLKGKTVAFVGDTISDSQVMAASDVSFAFLKGSLDRVTEVADVVLMKEDLNLIFESINLGKRTYSIIQQNIIITLITKLIIIIYIMFNKVPTGFLMVAIGIDLVISLLTILNCFRITKRFNDILSVLASKFSRNKEQ
ncbi:MAG: HAD-IC family P-type ATPase [Firmicutes bacterium]|nr:HAD-IC family P-type ATPase [Bacillota bacterium]